MERSTKKSHHIKLLLGHTESLGVYTKSFEDTQAIMKSQNDIAKVI